MRVGVRILPKNEVLDKQGRVVNEMLNSNGYAVSDCKVGRFVELDLQAENKDQALEQAKKIAEFVLYNPLIEKYSLEVLA